MDTDRVNGLNHVSTRICPLKPGKSVYSLWTLSTNIDHSPLYILHWMSLTVSDLDDFVLLGGGPPDGDLEGWGRNHAAHWRPRGGKGECLQSGILPLHRDRGMAPNHSPIGDTPHPLSFLPHLHNYICQSPPSPPGKKNFLHIYLNKKKMKAIIEMSLWNILSWKQYS